MTSRTHHCVACGGYLTTSGECRNNECPSRRNHTRPLIPAGVHSHQPPTDDSTERTARASAHLATIPAAPTATTQEAKGTDAPPLAIQVGRGGERLYVIHPSLIDRVKADPDQALRDGIAVPSLTGVLRHTADKSGMLMGWTARLTSETAEQRMKEVATLLGHGNIDGAKALVDALLQPSPDSRTGESHFVRETKGAYRVKRDASAERGTSVHAVLEDITRGGTPDVPPEQQGYVDAFHTALQDPQLAGMKYTHTEVTCLIVREERHPDGTVTETPLCAGTADAIVTIDGKNYVLDYKTNDRATVYPEVNKQLAGIASAKYILRPDGTREPMPPIHGGVAVALSPTGKSTVTRREDLATYAPAVIGGVDVWHANRALKKVS